MIRWSIFDDNERFKSALIETHQLYNQGVSSSEIILRLSATYQESEIKNLLNWIHNSSRVHSFRKEKMLLKISLWMLLIYKLTFLRMLPDIAHINITWTIVIVVLAPMLNIIMIILVYRLVPSSYSLILFLYIFGISNIGENINSLFSNEYGIIMWLVTFIYTITYFVGGYYSFKLFRALPEGLIKTSRLMEQLNLKTAAVA
jgi:hypothetical protein